MSSVVKDIHDELENSIQTLFPSKTKSKYVWDITRNAHKKNEELFAIRPSDLSSVSGVTKNATIDQTYRVILSTSFNNAPGNDEDLQDKVFDLFNNVSDLWNEAYRSKFGIARVLVCSGFECDEPEIDLENRVVSIETRFTIKYRTEVV